MLATIPFHSHTGCSSGACLGPVALFFNLKDNLDVFKDVEGHIAHLTPNSPINLYKSPQPTSLKEVDENNRWHCILYTNR